MAITYLMVLFLALLLIIVVATLTYDLVCYLLRKYVWKDVWEGQPTFDILRTKDK